MLRRENSAVAKQSKAHRGSIVRSVTESEEKTMGPMVQASTSANQQSHRVRGLTSDAEGRRLGTITTALNRIRCSEGTTVCPRFISKQ